MKTINDILQAKGHDIWSVLPTSSVFNAIRLMADHNIGALLVMEHGKIVGIMSERDYARKVILRGKSSKETPVREIMTDKVVYGEPGQTIEECMALLTHKRIRHLPVLSGDDLVGMISIGDVVKAIIAEQEDKIRLLEQYISAR